MLGLWSAAPRIRAAPVPEAVQGILDSCIGPVITDQMPADQVPVGQFAAMLCTWAAPKFDARSLKAITLVCLAAATLSTVRL